MKNESKDSKYMKNKNKKMEKNNNEIPYNFRNIKKMSDNNK